MRSLIALILSFVLATASVTMAVAHGQPPMSAEITLCTDAGTITVTLDAQGNPTRHPNHLCPDCTCGITALDLPAPLLLPLPALAARQVHVPPPQTHDIGAPFLANPARGPPPFA